MDTVSWYGVVVICFQISIFEPLETTPFHTTYVLVKLWFAFKLVSLNHWKQLIRRRRFRLRVVICFQISIFEPLETTVGSSTTTSLGLWFAFKLVSLNHWKQLPLSYLRDGSVVICFQISIFEPLETTSSSSFPRYLTLWFAFKLVSLNHWKQHLPPLWHCSTCCDLLSN